jgi:SAM-dependent methyltransferase
MFPALREGGYLDLRPPPGTFSDLTEYAEEEFHHREGNLRPLFLSARVKMDMMRKMLKPGPKERVLDIGCGNGRFVYFGRPSCAELVGIDAGARFAPEALRSVDLARGDVRLLPFADGSFDKAFSFDVLEHLTEDGVARMLSEARRVLAPGGELFLYSHVMMSSKLALFQRGVNRLVRFLDRKGLVDNAPERERKSDHRNPLKSYGELEALVARTGFEIAKIRYYNVFFKAVIEDLMLPLVEHNLYSKRPVEAPLEGRGHAHGSRKPDVGRWAHPPLSLASELMKLDVVLFGRVRTGPFFLLLRAI